MSTVAVAGVAPFSSVDWPGHLVATVFTQGCPWNCFYCHNPDLIDPRTPSCRDWGEVCAFLRTRRGLLDGVVFSGGEPTMQRALPAAIADVAQLGFPVGLHSGGAYPGLLRGILPAVDWIGLDIKALPDRYPGTTGRRGSGAHAWASLDLVLDHAAARPRTRPLGYEVRTTVYPTLWDAESLVALGTRLAEAGVQHWALQRFRPTGVRLESLPDAAGRDPDADAAGASRRDPIAVAVDALADRFASLTVR